MPGNDAMKIPDSWRLPDEYFILIDVPDGSAHYFRTETDVHDFIPAPSTPSETTMAGANCWKSYPVRVSIPNIASTNGWLTMTRKKRATDMARWILLKDELEIRNALLRKDFDYNRYSIDQSYAHKIDDWVAGEIQKLLDADNRVATKDGIAAHTKRIIKIAYRKKAKLTDPEVEQLILERQIHIFNHWGHIAMTEGDAELSNECLLRIRKAKSRIQKLEDSEIRGGYE